MISFFLIITCTHPSATAIMKLKNWERCQLERARYYKQDDPKHECLARCVGEKTYQEFWAGRAKR